MADLGIMQGRLVPPEGGRFQSFPRERWRDEFRLARSAGLAFIEWIYDEYGEDCNPLATEDGIAELSDLSSKHHIALRSVCADYFMDCPIVRATESELRKLAGKLDWLLDRCAILGIQRIVLPFVDASAITSAEDLERIVQFMPKRIAAARDRSIELHFETSLAPAAFAEMLNLFESDVVKANYDTGNSASLGFDTREELAAYGRRIGSVHIKDRVLGGSTVPLGTGAANIPLSLRLLHEAGYTGDYVLQIARSVSGDEPDWIAENAMRVKAMIDSAARVEGVAS